jgi:hypothetical protein
VRFGLDGRALLGAVVVLHGDRVEGHVASEVVDEEDFVVDVDEPAREVEPDESGARVTTIRRAITVA